MSEQQAGGSSGRVRKKSRKLLEAEEDNLETMKSPPAKRQRKSLEDGRTSEKTGQPSPSDSPQKSKSGTKNVIKVKSKPKPLSVDNKEGEKEPGKTPRGKTDTKVTTKNKPKASVAMAAPKHQQKSQKVASVSEEQPKKDQPTSAHNQAPSVPGSETSTENLELKSKAFEKSINTKPRIAEPAVGDDVGEIPVKTKKRSKVTQPSPSVSTPSPTGLARKREKKIKAPDSPDMEGHKKLKKCEKAGCPASFIICFSNASEKCARNGYTSRWYHMSPGEHFCNDCFDYFYRSHKGGYEDFTKWKRFWSTNGKTEASLKVYMADQCLPYWVRCNRCSKWRQLGSHCDFTTELVKKFECGMNGQGVKKEGNAACDVLEDKRVSEVFEPGWISTLWNPPYLVNSPAAPFLTEYYPDGVGMSASSTQNKSMNGKRKKGLKKQGSSDSESSETSSEESSLNSSGQSKTDPTGHDIPGLSPYLRPFYQPEEQRTACTMRPDVMDDQEVQEFPDFAAAQHMYLGIRNLVIAMWNLNIKEWLTAEKCAPYLLCRGLVRIRCYQELSRVIQHLTRVGWINFGIISPPQDLSVLPDRHKPEVIVIGAGAAGLGAAKQLKNFAAKVCILEAADRIGGRVWDDRSLGVCAGRGAMLVNGCINNPICVMCEQAGIKLHPISPTCDLIDESGKQIDGSTDKRIDFHFNALLDIIAEWRKERDSHKDCSLLGV
ncbi:lysine-specific histone demethylase 1B [Lingula anatina]|uniref:Lysine-specific histone demethylase 1B n=1 Tax=Lingula anatina TaxID=7574 RepID=A0A1S3ISL1_LINAN|nr:lysine-specific histone demethylase 1B [Lingula anatina]|eukprot:XP_013400926.1 lysine-specific histone demethylase 1B [Lingula anatina]